MINVFPYEYMHLVCLGVMRKLLFLWTRGKITVFRLSAQQVNVISDFLLSLKSEIPVEFNRKPRSLREIDRWKATEFRQLLLYTGPIVLKHVLPEEHYTVFMVLHVAIRILATGEFCDKFNEYAKSLLQYFVDTFEKLYGKEHISFNVHGLLHLSDDVKVHGPLDSFSAFRFENYLGQLKKLLKKSTDCLSQVHRRLSERQSLNYRSNANSERVDFPILSRRYEESQSAATAHSQFKSAKFEHFVINCDKLGNNIVILRDKTIVICEYFCEKSNGDMELIGYRFENKEPLFTLPCRSDALDIYVVGEKELSTSSWPVDDISQKCVTLPLKLGSPTFAVFPLCHIEV